MITYQPLNQANWPKYQSAILALEHMAFSAAQCHPASFYENILADSNQVSFIALDNEIVVGFSFSASLEQFSHYPGVQQDPHYKSGKVLYGADMVVDPNYRKQGIGKAFKEQQIAAAKSMHYEFIAGRNRLKYADAMWRVNKTFGAIEIQRLTGIYQDGREPNECIYYHITL